MPTPDGTGSEVQVVPALTVPMMTGLPNMPKPTAVQSEADAHEMPSRPATSDGIACGFHAYPSLTEERTESTPTAKQSAVLGHDAELKRLVPGGGVLAVHDRPPVVVLMTVEPAPRLPVLPTATQSSAAEQEIPVRSTAFAGGLWRDQVEPLLDVPTTYGVELRFVPTAIQVVSIGQAMEFNCDPRGIELVGCQSVKSVVVSEVAPPPEATPVATQVVDIEHATDSR